MAGRLLPTPPATPAPAEVVHTAWRNLAVAEAYHFSISLEQIIWPAPRLANTGRSSQRDTLTLTGEANLPAHTLLMRLHEGPTSALPLGNDTPGLEISIRAGQAQGRALGSEVWEPIPNLTSGFAAGGDLAAVLAGAVNIRPLTAENATSLENALTAVPGTRAYRFEVNGPAFAAHMRQQLEAELRAWGELPPGLRLDTSNLYADMYGTGLVWVDADGLPAQLHLDVAFPQEPTGERVELKVRTAFTDFARRDLVAAQPGNLMARLTAHASLTWQAWGGPLTVYDWGQAALQAALVLTLMVGALLLASRPASRPVYAALALTLIVALTVLPLLETQQAYAFVADQQAEQAAAQAEQQANSDLEAHIAAALATNWQTDQDPLAEVRFPDPQALEAMAVLPQAAGTTSTECAADSSDADRDGLSGQQECLLETDKNRADTDNDGLTDFQEAQLGTDPLSMDTDGDLITDLAEVTASQANGNWYLDPNSADTNRDGLVDSAECPERLAGLNAQGRIWQRSSAWGCADTDRDGIPDFADDDNDNDGVIDSVDLAPNAQAGPFGLDTPFRFSFRGLESNPAGQPYPVVAEFQLRPQNPANLGYALPVWNWSTGDDQGNVQETHDKTFADFLSAGERALNPSASNGDLRLIPMLELKLPNADLLPVIPARAVYAFDENTISGTVTLQQNGNAIALSAALSAAGSYTLTLSPQGPCAASVPPGGQTFTGLTGTVTLSPLPNQTGSVIITLTVSDGLSATSTLFVFTVVPVNDAPIALTDTAVVTVGVPVWLEVLANDTDVDSAQLRLVSVHAAGGTARLLGNQVLFTAGAGLPRTEVWWAG